MTRELELIMAEPAATSAAGPQRLAGTFLVDAHVHCYPGTDPTALLDHAGRNLAAAADAAGLSPAAGWLLFTERARDHVFSALHDGPRTRGSWTLKVTDEPLSLLTRGPGDFPLVLVGGRQIVTAEGLEVLALGVSEPVAEGRKLAATVAAVAAAGGLPVLPWGFGKWWGARGQALTRFLEQATPGSVFLGDNRGRPALAAPPRLFALAASRGILNLPGSDPLPLAAEREVVGHYGFVVDGAVDPARPAQGLLRLLRELERQPRAFGRRQRLAPFLAGQIAMHWRKWRAA